MDTNWGTKQEIADCLEDCESNLETFKKDKEKLIADILSLCRENPQTQICTKYTTKTDQGLYDCLDL